MPLVNTDSLAAAITALFGESVRVTDRTPVRGGDINRAYRLTLSDGSFVFMKCNAVKNLPFFLAEAEGLAALRGANAIGVPEPLACGADPSENASFLLMEYLSPAPEAGRYWETFGHRLAALHRADCAGLGGAPFGFGSDNFIGASPQKNTPAAGWVVFFRDCRLAPQLKMAEGSLDADARRQAARLLEQLDRRLPEPEFPSLLHGDLWSGNAVRGPDGTAWIVDPAAYVGHYEAELAMTELFGGFPPAFYHAYGEVNPIDGGYRERRELYNLYHLLNHLNLFGRSYLGPVRRILERFS